jgi:hypothetical protein
VLYVDLCNRRFAWLDSDMHHATNSHSYTRVRQHIDRHVTTPVHGFLDRLWAAARTADRRLQIDKANLDECLVRKI